MKLTPINKKLYKSILSSTSSDVYDKTRNSTSWEVFLKIRTEIYIRNRELIGDMQKRILRNLKNSSK